MPAAREPANTVCVCVCVCSVHAFHATTIIKITKYKIKNDDNKRNKLSLLRPRKLLYLTW